MTPNRTRWLLATTLSGALVVAVALIPGPDGYGQAPVEPAKAAEAKPGHVYSAIHCIGCHGGPDTLSYKTYLDDKVNNPTEFVQLTEHGTWHKDDLHSEAFKNIKLKGDIDDGSRAWRMQTRLKPHRDKDYRVDTAAECLTCHSVDHQPSADIKTPLAGRFHFENGVSCEACHGFAEKWFAPHVQAETWRKTDPKTKEGLGLVDLRDPYTRALKCASCHVGNKSEGKFVTHEMYAAGHPPLPPFELVTFQDATPRHSKKHSDNNVLTALDRETAWKNFHFRKDEVVDTRDLAVGTIAAFEATMQLLADEAAATAKTGALLDFAHFDCFACHHDLKEPSWRQKRGYPGAPGRPTLRSTGETLQAVLQHAESAPGVNTEKVTKSAGDIRVGLIALNKAYDAKPFGQVDDIAKQARALVGPCWALKDDLAPLVYDSAQTNALFRRLADRLHKPDGAYLDHDTAQQTVWALNVLQSPRYPAIAGNAKASEALGQMTAFHIRGPKREPVAGDRLEKRLERIEKFDPAVFLPRAQAWLKGFEK